MKSHATPQNMLLLHATLLIYAMASVLAKLAGLSMAQGMQTSTLLFVGLEFLALVVYTLLWQLILKRVPLSFAYANRAMCTLWTIVFGLIFFGEGFTLPQSIGVVLVLVGVYLVVSDHD